MPATAKLSRQFYDKLGDEVANELVEWFNTVDASYRQEFKDLFEANFGRVTTGMTSLRGEMSLFRAEIIARMDATEARVDQKLEAMKSELLRWMFLFWIGSMGTVIAILKL